jgi:hypothetical protein
MQIKVIAQIIGIELPDGINHLKLGHFIITKGEFVMHEFSDALSLQYFGQMLFDGLSSSIVICYFGDSAIFSPLRGITELSKVGRFFNMHINGLLLTLWLVKDNNAFISECFVQDSDTKALVYDVKASMTRNNQGIYQDEIFSQDEVSLALTYDNKIANYFHIENIEKTIVVKDESKDILTPKVITNADVKYDSYNRISRSIQFLSIARSQQILPARISFYIVLLESLFTARATEVTHQVSERTAIFIGKDSDDRIAIYDNVKKAYNVRSRYMHGDTLKDTDDLKTLSGQIDEILRRVYIKIYTEDPDVYKLSDKQTDNDKFEDYFKKLILTY